MKTEKTLYRIVAIYFAALAVSFAAGSCSAGGIEANDDRSWGEPAAATVWEGAAYNSGQTFRKAEDAAEPRGPELPEAGAVPGAGLSQKLVTHAGISIRVQDPEKAGATVDSLVEQYGAYASSATVWENGRNYSIRVPASSYTAFLSALGDLGRLLHRAENTEDVSLRYYDLEGRLATKRELLATYRSYLGRAKDIKEILSVEEKIAELEDDIDGTGKELRSLAGLVNYATVDLEILGPENIPSYAAPTLGERIGGLFGVFGSFLSMVLVILLGVVVYGIPSFLILALLFWLLFGRIGLVKKVWGLIAGKR
ncbi:MAG: DUF4349 domain-containing protein [Spirochaetaceae bacterium]|jgi:hypothetical protein|nr:DUF4349 domain-containing protein [Spirochaetaceae bacterium]